MHPEPQIRHRRTARRWRPWCASSASDAVRRRPPRACARCTCRCWSTATGSASTSRAAIAVHAGAGRRRAAPCSSPPARMPISAPTGTALEDRVPTWNYVAVEPEGPVRPLDRGELVRLLDDLSRRARGAARAQAALDPRQDERRAASRGCSRRSSASSCRSRTGAAPPSSTRTSRTRYATGSPTRSPSGANGDMAATMRTKALP